MSSSPKKSLPYYAYCILRLEADREWTVFPGIAERPVFPIREGRLAMLVSRLESALQLDAHSIIQHGRVVHRVFEQHTVLPFRFGTTFASEQRVRQMLLANRAEFQETINRLRGKAEMHVKLLFSADSVPDAGAEDLEGRQQACARWAAQRLAGLFRSLNEQISVRSLQNGELLVDFAHLIEDHAVAAYQRCYAAAGERLKGCQLLVSGPWPPYHFLPSAVRMPAASELHLHTGRRMPQRAAPRAQAAKA